jgi:rhodanese-related sulfurtransferase
MGSVPPIARPDPRAGVSRHLGRRVGRDLGAIVLMVVLSLAVGLAMNRLSSRPPPIAYQTPEQRFDAELTSLVAGAPFQLSPAKTLGLEEFRSAVESKSALILDARPSAYFLRGHVPGVLNLARDNFAQDYRRLSGVLKGANDKPIIVYCSGGACHDSRLVASALLSLGFTNIKVFTGGWEAWSAAGLPVSTG